jgi:hypothetical protein
MPVSETLAAGSGPCGVARVTCAQGGGKPLVLGLTPNDTGSLFEKKPLVSTEKHCTEKLD